VFVITIRPGFVRGNHYHTRKVEKFTVVQGEALISARNRETNDVKVYQIIAEMPETVTITPPWTHKISAVGDGCTLLCWVSEVFNPDDTDTFAEEV
jgi:UDP-2-acetamido-2,6-beta-L-arabino-hexul-4-ose reductase